jgi:uroporphyrinogen decarboxylase
MNSRERVIRAVEFSGPDKIPNGCYNLPAALLRYGDRLLSLNKRYPRDFVELYDLRHSSDLLKAYDAGTYRDLWGCLWRNIRPGLFGRVVEHPLKDLEELDSYEFPNPTDLIDFSVVADAVEAGRREGKYLLGDGENFYERIHWLHGFSETLVDITRERGQFKTLVDRMVKFKLEFIKHWLELDVDGVLFLDDWGTMDGLMVNPDKWRRLFKDSYAQMFREVHKKGCKVFFHSDGKVLDIMPDLIEIGVDAMNVQASLIGFNLLAKRFGGKFCILPDIDRQHLLPFGTPKEVEDSVKDLIGAFGHFDGGIISWGEIGPDVPLENAEAMLHTFEEYGRYPLTLNR